MLRRSVAVTTTALCLGRDQLSSGTTTASPAPSRVRVMNVTSTKRSLFQPSVVMLRRNCPRQSQQPQPAAAADGHGSMMEEEGRGANANGWQRAIEPHGATRPVLEHPPLMLLLLAQTICGGERWFLMEKKAEYIAKGAIASQMVDIDNVSRKALGMPTKPGRSRKERGERGRGAGGRTPLAVDSANTGNMEGPATGIGREEGLPPDYRPLAVHVKIRQLKGDPDVSTCTGAGGKNPSMRSHTPSQRGGGAQGTTGSTTCRMLQPCNAIVAQDDPKELVKELPPEKPLVSYDVLDCTFGAGLHTGAILEYGKPYTRVAALDCDHQVVKGGGHVRETEEEFGTGRFRFFAHCFSEAYGMFSEESFDAMVVDPGPNFTQLTDPSRGFDLGTGGDDMEAAGAVTHFDLRYGRHIGTPALQYLNEATYEELLQCPGQWGLPRQTCIRFAGTIERNRPFGSGDEVISALVRATNGYSELPDDPWFDHQPKRSTSIVMQWLLAIRAAVNNEYKELESILDQGPMLVRPGGRIVVFTRNPWEAALVRQKVDVHPYMLLSFVETVPKEEVEEFGHHPETQMWAIERTRKACTVLKNEIKAGGLTEAEIKNSFRRNLLGLDSAGVKDTQYPAANFQDRMYLTPEEKAARESNRRPMPKDFSTDRQGHGSVQQQKRWEREQSMEDSDSE